jgi:peptidyl-prolyl cis-trans isomerase C
MRKMIWVRVLIVTVFGLSSFDALADEPSATEENKIPPVVARVNGEEITEKQYISMWYTLQRARMRINRSKAMDPKYMDAMRLETIDRLVILALLSQRADALNTQPDPKDVESKIQEMKALRMAGNYGGLLATMGAGQPEEDWDSHRADLVSSMKIKRLLKQEVHDKVSVTPAEVRAYYDDNPDEFRVSEEVCARHILIKVPADATEVQRREARGAINEAAERIQKGETFKDVAKDVSQDGSASDGGNLGYFGRGVMVPEFEEVAFSLEDGQVSGVVETEFGYHLIKVEEKRPGSTISFDEIKAGIEQMLKKRKAEARGREYIANLKAEAEIEIVSF